MTTLALITLFILVVGFKRSSPSERDWQSAYRYWHSAAFRQRHRADDLQRRLTVRVLEVRALRAQLQRARQRTVHSPDSLEAIRLASIAYGLDYESMERLASCETGGTFSRWAKNARSTASGLYQFLTSTFASTPYGRESIFSPYANALAAGWMMRQGRRGEWVC